MSAIENTISTSASERCWYALYTRPRFEQKVDALLKQKELHSFLPQRETIRCWSNNRRRKIKEPLFKSYVFVFADLKERHLSVQTYGVARIVSFNGQPSRIPDEQIQSIYRILENGYDPEPHQFLDYGDQVEIVSGPLKGLSGFYIEDRGKNKIVISVAAIGRSIAVELKQGQVKLIKSGVGFGQRGYWS